MELPKFKYSPNAYNLDLFEEEEGTCSVCNQKRQLKYTGSFYSAKEPEYICPWCIANGKAAQKYGGEFNDYYSIEGVSANPDDPEPDVPKTLLTEITQKTPSYTAWQQQVWLTHCHEPCAFIGYADAKTIASFLDEVTEDIERSGFESQLVKTQLSKSGSLAGYLFQCVKCGRHRLHIDSD
ncbi:MAG TPA: CbrC family protein [Chitinophagales bacterium]|nr:CbrC family protein [Chitinophagales bacterium]HRK29046.1 CbrC family protein [Chitinophagales bacterium]